MRETEIKTSLFGRAPGRLNQESRVNTLNRNEMLSFFVMCVRNIHESYGPLVYTWPNSKINTGSHFYEWKNVHQCTFLV